jgi:hypothetical protein
MCLYDICLVLIFMFWLETIAGQAHGATDYNISGKCCLAVLHQTKPALNSKPSFFVGKTFWSSPGICACLSQVFVSFTDWRFFSFLFFVFSFFFLFVLIFFVFFWDLCLSISGLFCLCFSLFLSFSSLFLFWFFLHPVSFVFSWYVSLSISDFFLVL